VSPLEIPSLLRRHLLAVATICVLAAGITFSLERENPGYAYSGTVAVSSQQVQNKLFTYYRSLLAVEEVLNTYIGGPAAGSTVRTKGDSGGYTVTMVNYNNEQLPFYKNPYLNITATASSPEGAVAIYDVVVRLLKQELAALQGNGAIIGSSEPIKLTLAVQPGSLAGLQGSRVRSLGGIILLTIMATVLSASALDHWEQRQRRRQRAAT